MIRYVCYICMISYSSSAMWCTRWRVARACFSCFPLFFNNERSRIILLYVGNTNSRTVAAAEQDPRQCLHSQSLLDFFLQISRYYVFTCTLIVMYVSNVHSRHRCECHSTQSPFFALFRNIFSPALHFYGAVCQASRNAFLRGHTLLLLSCVKYVVVFSQKDAC